MEQLQSNPDMINQATEAMKNMSSEAESLAESRWHGSIDGCGDGDDMDGEWCG